jgi:hypothetical protein
MYGREKADLTPLQNMLNIIWFVAKLSTMMVYYLDFARVGGIHIHER